MGYTFPHFLRGERTPGKRRNALYSHKTDRIAVPPIDYYKQRADFYSIIFHELGHWTSHPSRCDREPRWFVSRLDYDYEEMIAEFVALHLCRWFNLQVSPGLPAHGDYIAKQTFSFGRHGIKPATRVIFEAEEAALEAVHYLLRLADNENYWRRPRAIRSIFDCAGYTRRQRQVVITPVGRRVKITLLSTPSDSPPGLRRSETDLRRALRRAEAS
jgi:Zincin-like metallopeptidase